MSIVDRFFAEIEADVEQWFAEDALEEDAWHEEIEQQRSHELRPQEEEEQENSIALEFSLTERSPRVSQHVQRTRDRKERRKKSRSRSKKSQSVDMSRLILTIQQQELQEQRQMVERRELKELQLAKRKELLACKNKEGTAFKPLKPGRRKLLTRLRTVRFGSSIAHCFDMSWQFVPIVYNDTEKTSTAVHSENGKEVAIAELNRDEEEIRQIVKRGLLDFAMGTAHGKVFLIGGHDHNGIENKNLLCFDPYSASWTVLCRNCPSGTASSHFLCQLNNDLLLFTGSGIFLFPVQDALLNNSSARASARARAAPASFVQHALYKQAADESDSFTPIPCSYYAAVQHQTTMYVFGGLHNRDKPLDQFFKIEVQCDANNSTRFAAAELPAQRNRPSARYKHCAILFVREGKQRSTVEYNVKNRYSNKVIVESEESLFVVFGGIDRHSRILNDMYVYNIALGTWNEVDYVGAVPPPLHSCSMFATEKYIYIYGGVVERLVDDITGHVEEITSNAMYRFEFDAHEVSKTNWSKIYKQSTRGRWSVVNVQGAPVPVASSPTAYQLRLAAGHKTVNINSKTVLTVGTDSETHELRCMMLYNIDDAGRSMKLCDWLWNCVTNGLECDVVIKSLDNIDGDVNKFQYLHCHKSILAARSHKFRELLAMSAQFEQQITAHDGANKSNELPVLFIEDYSTDVVHAFIRFLYTGTIQLDYMYSVSNLVYMAREYGHDDVMERICSVDNKAMYLDTHMQVLKQLTDDFATLLYGAQTQPEEHYADMTICGSDGDGDSAALCEEPIEMPVPDCAWTTSDPETVDNNDLTRSVHQRNMWRVHKVFMNRLPYIKTCLESGMEESQLGLVRFDEMQPGTMQCILRYIYTNSVVVDLDHVMDVYVHTSLLQLNALHEYVRSMVAEYITVDNVLSVLLVVDLYNDDRLKNCCIRFITSTEDALYERILNNEQFEHLSEACKRQLQLARLERQKMLLNRARSQQRTRVHWNTNSTK